MSGMQTNYYWVVYDETGNQCSSGSPMAINTTFEKAQELAKSGAWRKGYSVVLVGVTREGVTQQWFYKKD